MPLMKVYSKTEHTYITKHVNIDPRHVTVFLDKHDDATSIFCIYCSKKLMDAQYRIAQISPGMPPEEINYLKVKCANPSCKTFFWFIGVA